MLGFIDKDQFALGPLFDPLERDLVIVTDLSTSLSLGVLRAVGRLPRLASDSP